MTLAWALMRRSARRVAALSAALAVLVAALQMLLVIVAAAQEQAQSFDLIARMAPAFVQRQFGATLPVFLSFGGLVTFGYFHPVVVLMTALFAAFVASELAGDVESGQVDLLLGRPVARHWLVTRSAVLAASGPIVLVSAMLAATWIALLTLAPAGAAWPRASAIGWMAAHLVAIAWCFGALALAVAAVVKRRASAMGPASVAAVSLYLLDVLAGSWQPIRPAAVLSPFHYYPGPAILAGTADVTRNLAVLTTVSLVFTVVAYWRFSARDL